MHVHTPKAVDGLGSNRIYLNSESKPGEEMSHPSSKPIIAT